MENGKIKWQLLLQLGLIIPAITFVSIGANFYYEAGYFDYYRIPEGFIEIELFKNVHLLSQYIALLSFCLLIVYCVAFYGKSKTGTNIFIFSFILTMIFCFCFFNYSDTILPLIITDAASVLILFISTNSEDKFNHFNKYFSSATIKLIMIPIIIIATSFIICYQTGKGNCSSIIQEYKRYGSKNIFLIKYSDCIIYGIPDGSNNNLSAFIISRGKDNADTILIPKNQ